MLCAYVQNITKFITCGYDCSIELKINRISKNIKIMKSCLKDGKMVTEDINSKIWVIIAHSSSRHRCIFFEVDQIVAILMYL